MIKVITYGTYDLLHYGHIRLLERAKALGDYLIVGVTSDDFDKSRGKINVQQPLMARVQALRETGIADEIIIEEYEGQKIDDIKRYGADIFTVGSDWMGQFDYLNAYCQVVYLDRTQGVSSTDLRARERSVRFGLVGDSETRILKKYLQESRHVNGLQMMGVCASQPDIRSALGDETVEVFTDYDALLAVCDAVYILSHPSLHEQQIRAALLAGKSVLCESPVALSQSACAGLFDLAAQQEVVLMEAIKTAYATAYHRLLLLAQSGRIGRIVSVDATCTSLEPVRPEDRGGVWNSICAWGPTALLPIFQILGTGYSDVRLASYLVDTERQFDAFTRVSFEYPHAVAGVKVGRGVKSEGELVISGTEGYIYVPAPWWKTDYFEIRYENPAENKRYFYALEGEGIRYELVEFAKTITGGKNSGHIDRAVSEHIAAVMERYYTGSGRTIG